MKKAYIGVTIGPIYDTMTLASSPVSLWASSYLFSLLARSVCRLLTEHGVAEEEIITPFYRSDEPLLNKNDGVGLFHDRIVFSAQHFDIAAFPAVRAAAIREVADSYGIDEAYMAAYVQVDAALFEAENPVTEGNCILDSFELTKPFVASEEQNPITALFSGDRYSRNSGLRRTALVSSLQDFQLKATEDSFKSLLDIVSTGIGCQKYRYYAIVRADGDDMHCMVDELVEEEAICAFSRTCLEYCAAVAELVKRYSGITVYSSGDDLLAILPCESREGLTPLHFAAEANNLFARYFSGYPSAKSLSFGIAMANHKYPLYSALEGSSALLFGVAKRAEKSRIALTLQRDAGHSAYLVLSNEMLPGALALLGEIVRWETGGRFCRTAAQILALFDTAFNGAEDREQVHHLFYNLFHDTGYSDSPLVLERLPALFLRLQDGAGIHAMDEENVEQNDPALALNYLLRLCRFFAERSGDEE